MKKIFFLSILALALFSATSCKDNDDLPDNEFELNEAQSNWSKRLLIQRPYSNVPQALQGEYCEVSTGFLYVKGDTVSAYASLKLNTEYTYVFTSKNAGLTWTMQSSQNGFILSSEQLGEKSYALRSYLSNVEFGSGQQYGGSWSWSNMAGNPGKIRVLNKDTLYAFGADGIRVSQNGGLNWTINSTLNATDIQNYDENTLIGIFGNEIRVSDDLGSNWTLLSTVTQTLYCLYKNPDGHWFAGGKNGCVLMSADNGNSWIQKFNLTNIYPYAGLAQTQAIHFLDANNGFAAISCPTIVNCGDNFEEMTGCILRTLDGGETWTVNYRTEFIRYSRLLSATGPNVMALGAQYRDNFVSGIYLTLTTTLGN